MKKTKNIIKAFGYFTACLICFFGTAGKLPKLRPIPWVTHDAVLFLQEYMRENPDAKVLEFGSGASTLWFASKTPNLVSVEHSLPWYNKIKRLLKNSTKYHPVNYILHKRPYYCVCDQFPDESFDLILVDGRNRKGCIKHSIRILKEGGVLMVDNAERHYYRAALKLLKDWQGVKTVQTRPDSCGFTYNNWQTRWYIKPISE